MRDLLVWIVQSQCLISSMVLIDGGFCISFRNMVNLMEEQ